MSISIIRQNAEKDPNYCPYCMNCKGNVRMRKRADFLWSCKCGAIHDERRNYVPLNRVGVSIGVKYLVEQETYYESRIRCKWTDGKKACCETWLHRDTYPISERVALELASNDGWVLVMDKPVCSCHTDSEDGEQKDISNMIKYLQIKKDINNWSLEKCNEELGAACHYSCHTDVNEAREAVLLMMKEFK